MEHQCIVKEEVKEMKSTLIEEGECSDLASLFKMYADPTRLKILSVLFERELCVCDIAYVLDMSHSAISHQLATLRANRIIKARKEGKNVYYSLDDAHIQLIFNNGLSHIREE